MQDILRTFSVARFLQLLGAVGFCTVIGTPIAHAQAAAPLRARYMALREPLANNQFKRPLYLESSESHGELKGDIYAQIDKPYALIGAALKEADHWCDVFILHLNVKSCRAATSNGDRVLNMNIGRKFDRPLSDTYSFVFLYKVAAIQPDYMQVALTSAAGPMGTSNYRAVLEVVQLDAQRSFLHLSYGYSYGAAANVAMRSYLATGGRERVGFSIVGNKADGQPTYIRSVRGAVERNTMRYYLAVEAYLGALSLPASKQLEKRLNDWHTSVERYPLQLHEMDRAAYLAMKRKEVQRQQAPASIVAATP